MEPDSELPEIFYVCEGAREDVRVMPRDEFWNQLNNHGELVTAQRVSHYMESDDDSMQWRELPHPILCSPTNGKSAPEAARIPRSSGMFGVAAGVPRAAGNDFSLVRQEFFPSSIRPVAAACLPGGSGAGKEWRHLEKRVGALETRVKCASARRVGFWSGVLAAGFVAAGIFVWRWAIF